MRAGKAAVLGMTGLLVFLGSPSFAREIHTVTRVVDGDTVHLTSSAGEPVKVRMQGIDAPELHLPTDQGVVGQLPWGKNSTLSLSRKLPVGTHVELQEFGVDKYGRTIAHIFLNGKNLNLEQVRKGQAVTYIICDAAECRDSTLDAIGASELSKACHTAEQAGLGVFNPNQPLTEMPFEFRLRLQNRVPDKFVGDLVTGEYFEPEDYRQVPLCDRVFFLNETDAINLGYQKHR